MVIKPDYLVESCISHTPRQDLNNLCLKHIFQKVYLALFKNIKDE